MDIGKPAFKELIGRRLSVFFKHICYVIYYYYITSYMLNGKREKHTKYTDLVSTVLNTTFYHLNTHCSFYILIAYSVSI